MINTKQKAFTLVELIVVVTILAILATIGFVSYSSYLTGVRDTNRLAQLVSIHDGLELYSTKKDLPLPDDNVEVKIGTGTIAYQGTAGANTLETIDFTKGGQDPRDGAYFSYYLTQDRKYFQLMAFLEEEANITSLQITSPLSRGIEGDFSLIKEINATDYSNRIPTIYGKKLGILTDTINTPIQDIPTISSAGELVLSSTTDGYIAHLSDTSAILGTLTNSPLQYLGNVGIGGGIATSCKTIIDRNSSVKDKDGVYIIDLEGGSPLPVFCDMTTHGGGWTLVGNIQTTNASINSNSYENGLSTPNLTDLGVGAWLLDADLYSNHGTVIRTDFSGKNDYFKPVSGSNIKVMLQNMNKHQRSSTPEGSYITPDYHTGHLGGSVSGYPATYISGDSRGYLPFWGGNGANSGFYSSWGQTFKLYVR